MMAMYKNAQRGKREHGFTLIELLVVIAIIGILATIILVSLAVSRAKGNSASIKEHLLNTRNAAELYFSVNGTYGTPDTGGAGTDCIGAAGTVGSLFNDTTVSNIKTIIAGVVSVSGGASGVDCGASATAWSIAAILPGGGAWCVDNQGESKGNYGANGANTYTGGTNALYGAATAAHTSAGSTVCN